MISPSEKGKRDLEQRVSTLPEQAGGLLVNDQGTLTVANDFLIGVKALQKEINNTFDPIIQAAHEAHKQAITQKKRFEAPLIEAEKLIKPRIAAYLVEQEKIRREAEEVAKKAEEDRKGIEQESLRQAMKAEMAGKQEEAETILRGAAEKEGQLQKTIAAVPEKIKTSGLSTREVWRFEIVNPELLPREYLTPDTGKISKAVQVLKGDTNIPGIRVYTETVLAARVS